MAHESSNASIPASYQDTLDALARVADGNGNSFKLKLVRRANAASTTTQHIATFGDASWQHISDAESWIAPFCGGGLYILQVYDGKDAKKYHGQVTPSEITGAPRPPNPGMTRSASWLGPVLISCATDGNAVGATALSPFTSLAGEPGAHGTSPRTTAELAGLSSLFQHERAELGRKETELREREQRMELERIRAEADARAKALETRLSELRETLAKPASALDLPSLITGVLTAATPIIGAFLASSAEDRKAQVELERARQEREREERVAASKRPLIDPQILEIMDRQAKRAEEQSTQFSMFLKAQAEAGRANMESQSVAQRTMLQTIADVAQLQLKTTSGDDSPGIDWGKVISGVAAGLGALAQQARGQSPGPGQATGATPLGQPAGLPAGQSPAAPDVPESEALTKIEDRVRRKEPPTEIIVELKKVLAEDQAAQAEVKAMGSVLEVFEDRLGDFAEDKANSKYLDALAEAFAEAKL